MNLLKTSKVFFFFNTWLYSGLYQLKAGHFDMGEFIHFWESPVVIQWNTVSGFQCGPHFSALFHPVTSEETSSLCENQGSWIYISS